MPMDEVLHPGGLNRYFTPVDLLVPGRDEQEEEEAEKRGTFDRLTEAASELLDLGHEDIYQETRETLVVSLSG